MEKSTRPFGMRDKIGYAFGDFGNNFVFVFATMYLMVFCTDVLGIDGSIVGTLLIVSKLVDAFTDFTMGRICDNAKPTKEGRFRPWIKRMAIPMGISHMLIYMFWVRSFPYWGRIVWVLVTYILWGSIFYTACNIPYGSMASVITNDSKHRTTLSTFRTIGATIGGMAIGVVGPLVVYSTNADGQSVIVPEGFTLVAVIFGICAIVFYLLCYKLTTERVSIDPTAGNNGKPKATAGQTLKNLVSCRPLIVIILVALFTLLASLTTSAINTYLYKDYFNNTAVMSLASLLSTLSMLIVAPITPRLAGKFGKKEVGAIGLLIPAVVFFVLWILRVTNPIVFVVMNIISGMGLGLNSMISWAYIGDVIDYQELKSGIRNDGTVYSSYSFTRKIAQAAASGLGGFLLTMIGYVSSTEVVIQTETVKNGIYNCATLLPAVFYLLGFICLMFFYPLGKKQVEEQTRKLEEIHAAAEQA